MAKLNALPAQDVVDGFRGVLDFYTWCNLNIVRKWPKSPGRNRSEAVVATQKPFAYINKMADPLPETCVQPYRQLALGTGLSWKDYLVRLYINGSIRFHLIPPEHD